jgi:hypothetical protein
LSPVFHQSGTLAVGRQGFLAVWQAVNLPGGERYPEDSDGFSLGLPVFQSQGLSGFSVGYFSVSLTPYV